MVFIFFWSGDDIRKIEIVYFDSGVEKLKCVWKLKVTAFRINNLARLKSPVLCGCAAIFIGLLYIPAFIYGILGIWLIGMSGLIGWRFRLGIEKLNVDIDEKDPQNIRPYHLKVLILCQECVFYTTLPFLYFYIVYVQGTWEWSRFNGHTFDEQIDLFSLVPYLDLTKIASPYESPSLFIMATSIVQAFIIFVGLLLIAGKSYSGYVLRTMNPYYADEWMMTIFRVRTVAEFEFVVTLLLFVLLSAFYQEILYDCIKNNNLRVNITLFFLNIVAPYLYFFLLQNLLMRSISPFLKMRRKKND